ncbi:MAG TPA: tail fiber protein [Caulobacteraceae bacterium]|nr:tail fiber protein [Caulobacteraceae bacterium]
MSSPYVGEIRMFGGNFAPAGWAFCSGQLMAISENPTLFQLIGTTYGGDGQNTFALPDLQGRLPVHQGTGPGLSPYVIGQQAGTESVTLTVNQIPSHNHNLVASTDVATLTNPSGGYFATAPTVPPSAQAALYVTNGAPAPTTGNLTANSVGQTGGSQPHDNVMPFLCVSFIISLFGIFPSQN